MLTFASPERARRAMLVTVCAPGYSSAMECESDVIRHPIFGANRHLGQRGRACAEPARSSLGGCFRAPSRKCALLSFLELRCCLCRLPQHVSSHCRAILIGDRAVLSETVSLSLRPLRSLQRQWRVSIVDLPRRSFAPISEPRRYCQYRNTSIRNAHVRSQ